MVTCPWCGQEVPLEEYSKHYSSQCPKNKQPQQPGKVRWERESTIDAVIIWDVRHTDPIESMRIRKQLLEAHSIPKINTSYPHHIQVYIDLRKNEDEYHDLKNQLVTSIKEYTTKYNEALEREEFNLKYPGEGASVYYKPVAVEISNYGGSILCDDRFVHLAPFLRSIDGR